MHSLYSKVYPPKFYVCADYDPTTGKLGDFFFVMPMEVELSGNYKTGDKILVNGKQYILGERSLDRKSTIASYELIKKAEITALVFDE